ncbi:MAG: DUF305 domain-containing protein [Corynebacterium sp.]|uniref:DUF305 domain-containing protein n=1 Tax=Corynebacterium sp. TaxID=1720 RepID=UPI0026DEF146|nr:DUF305 domain-containing protein [Corynebacterium sp.]MDO5669035.1 DUF305 domain-containing protein [Corynebacterium sp.]
MRAPFAVLAALLFLVGCSPAQSPVSSEQMVSERTDAMPAEANDTDVHFLGMMVPHHQQAIDMAEVLLDSDVDDAALRDLAERIREGQERENAQMNEWAKEWGIEEDMELHSRHIANGMVSPGVYESFTQLEGEELRTRFLELMHFHHAEVIAMTQDQVDNGGYAPLRDMATEMIEVQTAEMREMEQLYGGVPNP